MDCSIAKGELLRLEGGKSGLFLSCTSGAVWLTLGDGADYLIQNGKSFEIPAQRLAVVEALECSEFHLGEPLPANPMLHKPIIGFAAC